MAVIRRPSALAHSATVVTPDLTSHAWLHIRFTLGVREAISTRVLSAPPPNLEPLVTLQRLQEIDQVLHILRRESHLEALVVEVHNLRQVRRRSVVEVGGARRQSTQHQTLAPPMSVHWPLISALPGSVV